MEKLRASAQKLRRVWEDDYNRTIEDSLDAILHGLIVLSEHIIQKEEDQESEDEKN